MTNQTHPLPVDEMTIEERLDKHPESYTDDQLRQLMSYPRTRGRSSKIAPKAFLILDARHSPTKGKR